jgi:hypothetical protein
LGLGPGRGGENLVFAVLIYVWERVGEFHGSLPFEYLRSSVIRPELFLGRREEDDEEEDDGGL